MNSRWITYLILLGCVIAWGSNFVFGSILVAVFDPSIIAFFRLIFILLFLFIMLYKKDNTFKLTLQNYIWLAVAGVIGVSLNQWSFYASLQYTEPVTAALILALSPIVTALLSSYYFKERKTLLFWLGSFIALLGVWLVITEGSLLVPSFGKGEILISLTMLSFSVFLVFVQHLSKTIPTSIITLYSNIFGLLGLLPFVPWNKTYLVLAVPFSYWLLLIITAVIMHGLCTYLWNSSIYKVGASKAALLLNLEPFVAMVFGLLLLDLSIQPLQLIGAFVIIIGVTISLRTKSTIVE